MLSSINHHREGAGPPLVLLHGVGHHWQAWQPVIGLLAREFDVIACDSPGFGRSQPLAEGIEPSIGACADAFERFFAQLGIERPLVAGNSMGGGIALELGRRGCASAVSAFSPVGFWTPAERRFCQVSLAALAQTPVPARPAVARLARTRPGRVALFWQTFGWPTRMPAHEAEATLRDAWASPAFTAALAAFDGYTFGADPGLAEDEVTIAWGNRDRLLPYRLQAPRARAALPRARHLTLGAGHVPFFDDPAAIAEVIRSGARLSAP